MSAGPPAPTAGASRLTPSFSPLFYACARLAGPSAPHWSPGLVLAAMAAIIVLDVRGYSFTARRLALGGSQTAVAIALAAAAYRAIAQAISRNAWRWAQPNRSWAMALTSAMALRAKVRSRGPLRGSIAEPPGSATDWRRRRR